MSQYMVDTLQDLAIVVIALAWLFHMLRHRTGR